MSLFDRTTWCGARLAGGPEEDKSETFVAQARTLLDSIQVRSHTLHSKMASGCRCVSNQSSGGIRSWSCRDCKSGSLLATKYIRPPWSPVRLFAAGPAAHEAVARGQRRLH